MRQGQEREAAVAFVETHDRRTGFHVLAEVPVREHHAFRKPCRSRGIDDGGNVFRIYLNAVKNPRFVREDFFSRFLDVVQVDNILDWFFETVHDDNKIQIRQVLPYREDFAQLQHVGNDYAFRAAVLQYIFNLVRRQRGVKRHVDSSDIKDGHIGKVPSGTIFGEYRHPVLLGNAVFTKISRKCVHVLFKFAVRDRFINAVDFPRDGEFVFSVAVMAEHGREQLR